MQLALEERFTCDPRESYMLEKLADLAQYLQFTREDLNTLIGTIIPQPTKDGLKKVQTIYALILAGGDINELVIDGKNGLVKLMEMICQDEVWSVYEFSDMPLEALFGGYVQYVNYGRISREQQHLTTLEPSTLARTIEVALTWRSSPTRFHPLFRFLRICHDRYDYESIKNELSKEVQLLWQKQLLLGLIKGYADWWTSSEKKSVEQMAKEVMPQGDYLTWLFDHIVAEELSDEEFRGAYFGYRSTFLEYLRALGVKNSSNIIY